MITIAIHLFGGFQVARDGVPISYFRGDKVRALLAYLATEAGRPHARDSVAALLWPDQPNELALRNLSQALVRLRRAIGASSTLIDATRHTIAWVGASAYADVSEFAQLARSADPEDLTRAAALYRGEFLSGFSLPDSEAFEEWLLLTREQLAQQAVAVLSTLAEQHLAARRFVAAAESARRQLALDPWRETAHRQLMWALALAGDQAAALAAYTRCRKVLQEDLGIAPDMETRALYERIRSGLDASEPYHATSPQHNLPMHLTPFVGREDDIATLTGILGRPDLHLLTLLGIGGMGKTRLAVELARTSLDRYADGIFFIALAPLSSADAIPAAIAHALGMAAQANDLRAAVLHVLRDKHMLLVLDNFEHLPEGAGLVAEIIQAAPRVQIIATSRARLLVYGEYVHQVEGLAYSQVADSAAVRLFVQSARRTQSSFRLHDANLPAVLRICRLVQGMPLGLELAAAWSAMLSPQDIAAEIERNRGFLEADWPGVPARQRSLRAVFMWSWGLLSEADRRVLRHLAVFRGSFSREAAEAVAGATLRTLTSLMHKSLLRRVESRSTSAAAYEIHELLRQFAAEQLAAAEEYGAVMARHSHYYLQFLAARERRIARDEPREAIAELEDEIDNIRQAWAWAADHAQADDLYLAAFCFAQFYRMAGASEEWARVFGLAAERLAAHLASAPSPEALQSLQRALSTVWTFRGSALILQGKNDQARLLAEQAIELARACGNAEAEAHGSLVKGQALRRQGQSAQARALFEQAAALALRAQPASGARESQVETALIAYNWLCSIALTEDDYAAARGYVDEGLRMCQPLKKRLSEMIFRTDLMDIAQARGEYAVARHHGEAALHLARTLGYLRGENHLKLAIAEVARLQGEYGYAQELIDQALTAHHTFGDLLGEAGAMNDSGYLQLLMGNLLGAQHWFDRWEQTLRAAELLARESFQGILRLALLAHAAGDYAEALRYAEDGWRMACQLDGRASQANALVILGMAHAGLRQLEQAASAYSQALDFYTALEHLHKAAEPRAGLAQIALAQGDLPRARAQAEAMLAALETRPYVGVERPFAIYLACYQVLAATNDARAAGVLHMARRRLQEYASHIPDRALRQSFLENVPAHQALLRAYAALPAEEYTSGLGPGGVAL